MPGSTAAAFERSSTGWPDTTPHLAPLGAGYRLTGTGWPSRSKHVRGLYVVNDDGKPGRPVLRYRRRDLIDDPTATEAIERVCDPQEPRWWDGLLTEIRSLPAPVVQFGPEDFRGLALTSAWIVQPWTKTAHCPADCAGHPARMPYRHELRPVLRVDGIQIDESSPPAERVAQEWRWRSWSLTDADASPRSSLNDDASAERIENGLRWGEHALNAVAGARLSPHRRAPSRPVHADGGEQAAASAPPHGDGYDYLVLPLARALVASEYDAEALPWPLAYARGKLRTMVPAEHGDVYALAGALCADGTTMPGARGFRTAVVHDLRRGLDKHAAGEWRPCKGCKRNAAKCPPEHAAWIVATGGIHKWYGRTFVGELKAYARGDFPPRIALPAPATGGRMPDAPPPLDEVCERLGFDGGAGPGPDQLHMTPIEVAAYERAVHGESLPDRKARDRDRKALARACTVIRRFRDVPLSLERIYDAIAPKGDDGGGMSLEDWVDHQVNRRGALTLADRAPRGYVADEHEDRMLAKIKAAEHVFSSERDGHSLPAHYGDGGARRTSADGGRLRMESDPDSTAAYLAGKGCAVGATAPNGWRYSSCPSCAGPWHRAGYSLASGVFTCFSTGCDVGAACYAAGKGGRAASIPLATLVAICDGPAAAAASRPSVHRTDKPDAPSPMLPGQRTLAAQVDA